MKYSIQISGCKTEEATDPWCSIKIFKACYLIDLIKSVCFMYVYVCALVCICVFYLIVYYYHCFELNCIAICRKYVTIL